MGQLLKSVPTAVEARLSEADRDRLDKNFQSWKDLLRLHLPIVIGMVAIVVICLMGSIMLTISASQKKQEYEQRLQQLNRVEQECAERNEKHCILLKQETVKQTPSVDSI